MSRYLTFALLAVVLVAAAGCRGSLSEKPPVHPNLNMDFAEHFEPQELNTFFDDRRAMRMPVPGTVARGMLKEDSRFHYGRTEDGEYVELMPVPITTELLERGRERYNIFCSVCHGGAGAGYGIIRTGNDGQGYGYTIPTSYHQDRLRYGGDNGQDGYLYDVVANGIRSMPGYAQQIPVADRWAIVSYIRALQRSQNAIEGDIPPSVLVNIQQGSSANMNAARTGTD